jgi:hypothetical protein
MYFVIWKKYDPNLLPWTLLEIWKRENAELVSALYSIEGSTGSKVLRLDPNFAEYLGDGLESFELREFDPKLGGHDFFAMSNKCDFELVQLLRMQWSNLVRRIF